MDNESGVAVPLAAEEAQTDVQVDSSPSTEEGVVAESPTAEEESQSSVEAVQQALELDQENADIAGGQHPEPEQSKPQEPQQAEGENKAQEETEDLYVMPEEVRSDKAKARFEELVSKNKEYKSQADELSERIGTVDKAFEQSSCSGEEISQLLDLGRMLKSTNRNDLETAWNLVQDTREKLAVVLGKTEVGANVLPSHLKERVDNFELNEEDAFNLANADLLRNQLAQQQAVTSQQQQQQQQQQASVNTAVQAIQGLEQEWSAKDPEFASKRHYFITQIPSIREQYPPEYWGSVLNQIYQAIPFSSAENNKQQRPNALRPSSIGTGNKQPKDTLEAVSQALGMEF